MSTSLLETTQLCSSGLCARLKFRAAGRPLWEEAFFDFARPWANSGCAGDPPNVTHKSMFLASPAVTRKAPPKSGQVDRIMPHWTFDQPRGRVKSSTVPGPN